MVCREEQTGKTRDKGNGGDLSAADLLFPFAPVQRFLCAGFFTLLYHLQQAALPNPSLHQSMIPLLLCFFSLLSASCCFQHLLVSLLTRAFEEILCCILSDLFRSRHLNGFATCKKQNWHPCVVSSVYSKSWIQSSLTWNSMW